MKNYIDWKSQLLPCMRGYITDPTISIQAMQEMFLRFGVNSFCMTADFDCSVESVNMFLIRLSRSQELLKPHIPKNLYVNFFASVLLFRDLSLTPDLEKLLFSSQKLLPIKLPIGKYEDWMDLEFNHLLYKNKFRLLFTSFETAIIWYPPEIVEKLMRISGAVFQFNYKSLVDPKICRIIKKLIAQKSRVLLGTSLDSLGKIYFYEFDHYIHSARLNFSAEELRILLDNNRSFWNK